MSRQKIACKRMRLYQSQPWPNGRYTLDGVHKSCRRNASLLARDHPDELTLIKGFALTPIGDVWAGHWWTVDKQGRVVDPTWENDGQAYVGLEEVDLLEEVRQTAEEYFDLYWALEVEQVAPLELEPLLDSYLARMRDEA